MSIFDIEMPKTVIAKKLGFDRYCLDCEGCEDTLPLGKFQVKVDIVAASGAVVEICEKTEETIEFSFENYLKIKALAKFVRAYQKLVQEGVHNIVNNDAFDEELYEIATSYPMHERLSLQEAAMEYD